MQKIHRRWVLDTPYIQHPDMITFCHICNIYLIFYISSFCVILRIKFLLKLWIHLNHHDLLSFILNVGKIYWEWNVQLISVSPMTSGRHIHLCKQHLDKNVQFPHLQSSFVSCYNRPLKSKFYSITIDYFCVFLNVI